LLNYNPNDKRNATQQCLTGEQKLVTKIISYPKRMLLQSPNSEQ